MLESNSLESLLDHEGLPEIQPQPALQEVAVESDKPEMPVIPDEQPQTWEPLGVGLDPLRLEEALRYRGYKAKNGEETVAPVQESKQTEDGLNDPFFSEFDPAKAYTPDFVATKGLQRDVEREDRRFLDRRIRMKSRSLGAKLRSAGKDLWSGVKNLASNVLPGAAARRINSDLGESVSLGEITEAEFTDLKQKTVTDKLMGWVSGRDRNNADSGDRNNFRNVSSGGDGNNPGNPGGGSDGGSIVHIPKKSRWKSYLSVFAAGAITALGANKAYDHYVDGQTNQPTDVVSASGSASVNGIASTAPSLSPPMKPSRVSPKMASPIVELSPVPKPKLRVAKRVAPSPKMPVVAKTSAKSASPKDPEVSKEPQESEGSKELRDFLAKVKERVGKISLTDITDGVRDGVMKTVDFAKRVKSSVIREELKRAEKVEAIVKKIPAGVVPPKSTDHFVHSLVASNSAPAFTIKRQKESFTLIASARIILKKVLDPDNGFSIQEEANEFVKAQKMIDQADQLANTAGILSIAHYIGYSDLNIGSAKHKLDKLKGMGIPTSSPLIFKDSGQSFDNLNEYQRQLLDFDLQAKSSMSLDAKGAEKLYRSTKRLNDQLGKILRNLSAGKKEVKSEPLRAKAAGVVTRTKSVVRSTVRRSTVTGDQLIRFSENPWIVPRISDQVLK